MRYYLSVKYAYKEYGDIFILFAKTSNPNNEFYELNNMGKVIVKFIISQQCVTKEELFDFLKESEIGEFDREDISNFLDILVERGALCLKN